MQTGEEAGMLNVIPKVRQSPNHTPHRITHSPYDTSVIQSCTVERDTSLNTQACPQVRTMLRLSNANGTQLVTVGSSNVAGRGMTNSTNQYPNPFRGDYGRGVDVDRSSHIILNGEVEAPHDALRDKVLSQGNRSAHGSPDASHHAVPAHPPASITTGKSWTNKPYAAATPYRQEGPEVRPPNSYEGPYPDHGLSRGTETPHFGEYPNNSQTTTPVSATVHHQYVKVENESSDYQRNQMTRNTQQRHQQQQQQQYHQQKKSPQQQQYGNNSQAPLYESPPAQHEGYEAYNAGSEYYHSPPHQVHHNHQHHHQYQHPQSQQTPQHHPNHHQHQHQHYQTYATQQQDSQGWQEGVAPGYNYYSDPNNPTSLHQGGNQRYPGVHLPAMPHHQHHHQHQQQQQQRQPYGHTPYNSNSNTPLPPQQQQHLQQRHQQQWPVGQMPYSTPNGSPMDLTRPPNMGPNSLPQHPPSSTYPTGGEAPFSHYPSSVPTARVGLPTGAAPPMGPSYVGPTPNWGMQSKQYPEEQLYPQQHQHHHHLQQNQQLPSPLLQPIPPAYGSGSGPASPYNAVMHRPAFVEVPNYGAPSHSGPPTQWNYAYANSPPPPHHPQQSPHQPHHQQQHQHAQHSPFSPQHVYHTPPGRHGLRDVPMTSGGTGNPYSPHSIPRSMPPPPSGYPERPNPHAGILQPPHAPDTFPRGRQTGAPVMRSAPPPHAPHTYHSHHTPHSRRGVPPTHGNTRRGEKSAWGHAGRGFGLLGRTQRPSQLHTRRGNAEGSPSQSTPTAEDSNGEASESQPTNSEVHAEGVGHSSGNENTTPPNGSMAASDTKKQEE